MMGPQGMTHPMQDYRVQTRIGRQHLKGGTRGRVPLKYALNVFSNPFEHNSVFIRYLEVTLPLTS
jgi:hypothetical protein